MALVRRTPEPVTTMTAAPVLPRSTHEVIVLADPNQEPGTQAPLCIVRGGRLYTRTARDAQPVQIAMQSTFECPGTLLCGGGKHASGFAMTTLSSLDPHDRQTAIDLINLTVRYLFGFFADFKGDDAAAIKYDGLVRTALDRMRLRCPLAVLPTPSAAVKKSGIELIQKCTQEPELFALGHAIMFQIATGIILAGSQDHGSWMGDHKMEFLLPAVAQYCSAGEDDPSTNTYERQWRAIECKAAWNLKFDAKLFGAYQPGREDGDGKSLMTTVFNLLDDSLVRRNFPTPTSLGGFAPVRPPQNGATLTVLMRNQFGRKTTDKDQKFSTPAGPFSALFHAKEFDKLADKIDRELNYDMYTIGDLLTHAATEFTPPRSNVFNQLTGQYVQKKIEPLFIRTNEGHRLCTDDIRGLNVTHVFTFSGYPGQQGINIQLELVGIMVQASLIPAHILQERPTCTNPRLVITSADSTASSSSASEARLAIEAPLRFGQDFEIPDEIFVGGASDESPVTKAANRDDDDDGSDDDDDDLLAGGSMEIEGEAGEPEDLNGGGEGVIPMSDEGQPDHAPHARKPNPKRKHKTATSGDGSRKKKARH